MRAGDRVALYLQNVPQFVIGMLATWKAGGIAVPVNPMNRARELEAVLSDSGARVLLCLESLYRDVVAGTGHHAIVVTTSELDYRARDDQRVFAGLGRIDHPGAHDMAALIERHRGQVPPAVTFGPGDTAFLTYTSGTTGPPKGAMNTFCREQMAAYKYPRQVEFLDELPKTVSGKLLRRELRDRG